MKRYYIFSSLSESKDGKGRYYMLDSINDNLTEAYISFFATCSKHAYQFPCMASPPYIALCSGEAIYNRYELYDLENMNPPFEIIRLFRSWQ